MPDDGKNIVRDKIDQALSYMRDESVDLWIIYASDRSDPVLPLIPGVATVGPGAFLFAADGTRHAVCSAIDAQDIEESGLFDTVSSYVATESIETPLRAAVASTPHRRVALNVSQDSPLCDGLTEGRYRSLVAMLGGDAFDGEFVSSERFLTRVRSIKSEGEIAAIRRAIEVTCDIYDEVFARLHVGLTEYQIGAFFVEAMRRRGVVNGIDRSLSMPIVMKERFAHRAPGEAIVEAGDLLIMDFSVEVDEYVSDIARTVYFLRPGEGAPPEVVQTAFDAVHGAVTSAFRAIRPGVQGYEVDRAARNYLLGRGYPEITHATGHQVGRAVHDGGVLLGPQWARYGSAPNGVIEEGMVFTIEPTIIGEGRPSFIVEDICAVREDGAEFLSRRQDELILIR